MENQHGKKRKADAMGPSQCPLLVPRAFVGWRKLPFGLRQIKEIEDHYVSSGNSCHHPPLKDLVFNEGSPPLILACIHGDLEAVKHIVEIWGVNVEATGVYYKNAIAGTIESASPLFVAASCLHLEIVRYLVEKGADVTSTTISNAYLGSRGLTPLHGAFFAHYSDSNSQGFQKKLVDVVILLLEAGSDPSALPFDRTPMWANHCCNVEATKALIDYGMDLNQRYTHHFDFHFSRNITILHKWAGSLTSNYPEKDCLAIIKLLVDKGADLLVKDDEGFTPLLAAAQYVNGYVLDFLLERDNYSRMEKIEAMELAGAGILIFSLDTSYYPDSVTEFPRAFDYWRRSLQLRQMGKEGTKIPMLRESGGTVEWVTSEDLERVIEQPSEYMIQGFLVRFRILSRKSWGALFFLLDFVGLKEYWQELTDLRDFVKLLHLSWAMLEALGRFNKDEPCISYWLIKATQYLVEALFDLEEENANLLTVNTIERSLDFISNTDHLLFKDIGQVHETESALPEYYMKTLLRLVTFLATTPRMLDEITVKAKLEAFVQRARCDKTGQTLLHFACKSWYLSYHLSLPTIRFLLEAGADPTKADVNGNTPLHVLAWFHHFNVEEFVASAASLLFEKGAHLCQVNKYRKTAENVWIDRQKEKAEKRAQEGNEDEFANHLLSILGEESEDDGSDGYCHFDDDERALGLADPPLEMPPWLGDDSFPLLQCLTAKVIRTQNVSFLKLPPSLKRFVKLH